jgi:hypothetical protein
MGSISDAEIVERELEGLRRHFEPTTLVERLAEAEARNRALTSALDAHRTRWLRWIWPLVVLFAIAAVELSR